MKQIMKSTSLFKVTVFLSFLLVVGYASNLFAMGSAPPEEKSNEKLTHITRKDEQTQAPNKQNISPSQAEKKLVVEVTSEGITVQSENAEVYELIKKIGVVTGIPIHILDPDQKGKHFVTISFKNLPIQMAIEKILATLPAGGFATVSQKNSKTPITEIYVMTKQGTEQFMGRLETLRERIINGEKLSSKELSLLLIETHRLVGQFDSQQADIYLTPAYYLLFNNFKKYRDVIFTILNDKDMPGGLRYALLEMVDEHWEDPESQKAARTIFDNPDKEPSYLIGKSAKVLAKHKVDISDEVMKRFDTSDEHVKFSYITALALLNKREAIPLFKKIAINENNDIGFPVQISALRALSDMDINNIETMELMTSAILKHGKQSSQQPDKKGKENNVLAMQTVQLLAKSSAPDVYEKIIGIASNEAMSVDVRVSAVEALGSIGNVPKERKINDMDQLKKQISVSTSLSKPEKDVVLIMINSVIPNK